VQVLVDHAGADVGDFGTLGEPVDDERVQIAVVSHGDVDEEIPAARLRSRTVPRMTPRSRRLLVRSSAVEAETLTAAATARLVRRASACSSRRIAWSSSPRPATARSVPNYVRSSCQKAGYLASFSARSAQANRIYDDYLAEPAETKPEDLAASAVSIIGPRNRISKLVRNLDLLR
jgi:hypothetical protein